MNEQQERTVLKIRIGGQRVKIRVQGSDELITERSMQCHMDWHGTSIEKTKFLPSACVGEKVSDHPDRTYIEVLSPWFVTGSHSCDP